MDYVIEKPKRGRPRGQRFDRKVDFRVSQQMYKVLRKISHDAKVPMSQIIRVGVEHVFANAITRWIETARTGPLSMKKLNAIKKIHEARKAVLANSKEYGLPDARYRAAMKNR